MSRRASFTLLAILMTDAATQAISRPADAQTPGPTRIRGDIESVDAHEIRIISRRGEKFTLQTADDLKIQAIVPIAIDAIKPGSFIGSAAVGQPDGTLRAQEVHVFPEAMRGTGEGHRSFDLGPGSTMTNGTVGEVIGSEGRTLKVNYKGGEKTIFVSPETPIVAYEPGGRELLNSICSRYRVRHRGSGQNPDGHSHCGRQGSPGPADVTPRTSGAMRQVNVTKGRCRVRQSLHK